MTGCEQAGLAAVSVPAHRCTAGTSVLACLSFAGCGGQSSGFSTKPNVSTEPEE